jgi:PhnB protein
MKFMIFVKSNPSLEKSIEAMSGAALKVSMAKMNTFNEELKKAGVMKDCDGLRPSREGKRVRFDGQSRSVADGCVCRKLDSAILMVKAAKDRS